ncbi:MAG: right-handed parallel beta-helix repeat-containing protein, partial [bacterium]
PLLVTAFSQSRIMKIHASTTFKGLRFKGDGILVGTPYAVRFAADGNNFGNVVFEDCEFSNFRVRAIHPDRNNWTDSLIVNNCIFREVGESGIRYNKGVRTIGVAKFTNNTFYKIGENAIYLQNVGELEVSHNTFFFSDSTISGRHGGGVRARDDTVLVIRDNIFVKLEKAARVYGSAALSPTQAVEYNLFWDNLQNIIPVDDSTRTFPIFNFDADPVFEDTSAANLSLALGLGTSPAVGAASDGTNLGDPRWGTFNDMPEVTLWEVAADSVDWYAPVKGFLTAGDTVEFVTDGGFYFSPGSITLPEVPLTLMAKPGLSEKPLITAAFGSSRIFKIQAATTFKGLRFKGDGILVGTPYGVRFAKDGNELGTVIFEDCEFSEFRLRGIHLDKNNHTDTLIVNNCIFREIGESGMREKNPTRNVEVAKITNSTFYKIGEQGIRLQNVGELEVSHCTFAVADTTISGRAGRGLYARDDTVVVVRNNIFAYIQEKAVRVYGPSPTVEYNLFWQNGQNIVPEDDSTLTFPIFNFDADPVFKDTSAANLDLALEVNTSPAVGAASDGTNLGDPRWGTWDVTGVKDHDNMPRTYRLSQNYPNPFNPETHIEYDLPKKSEVKLTVYNMLGQKIVTLVNKEQGAGSYSVVWHGKNDNGVMVSSGIYFYRIEAGDFIRTKKMLLLK